MYARLSRFAGLPPEQIEETIKEFEEEHLPALEEAPGFQGIMVGVDWNSGRAAAVTFWETREALEESEQAADRARTAAIDRAEPVREPIIDRYEVVLQREREPS